MANSVVAKVCPSITNLIRKDHSKVTMLYHRYKGSMSLKTKRVIADSLCTAISLHAALEEEIFYPAVRRVTDDLVQIEEHYSEHRQIKAVIAKLQHMHTSDIEFDNTVHSLMGHVLHHVADEESILLPQAEQRLDAETLQQLGAQMLKRKMQLMAENAHPMEYLSGYAKTHPGKIATIGAALLAAGAAYLFSNRKHSYLDAAKNKLQPVTKRFAAGKF